MTTGRLIIVCGLPGSGKTTAATALAAEWHGLRLSPDEWLAALDVNVWDTAMRERVETLQWAVARRLLVLGTTVIIEWGTWGRSERDTLRLQARDLGAEVHLRYLDADDEELWRRIRERAAEDPPIKRSDIDEWRSLFEAPDERELSLYDEWA